MYQWYTATPPERRLYDRIMTLLLLISWFFLGILLVVLGSLQLTGVNSLTLSVPWIYAITLFSGAIVVITGTYMFGWYLLWSLDRQIAAGISAEEGFGKKRNGPKIFAFVFFALALIGLWAWMVFFCPAGDVVVLSTDKVTEYLPPAGDSLSFVDGAWVLKDTP